MAHVTKGVWGAVNPGEKIEKIIMHESVSLSIPRHILVKRSDRNLLRAETCCCRNSMVCAIMDNISSHFLILYLYLLDQYIDIAYYDYFA